MRAFMTRITEVFSRILGLFDISRYIDRHTGSIPPDLQQAFRELLGIREQWRWQLGATLWKQINQLRDKAIQVVQIEQEIQAKSEQRKAAGSRMIEGRYEGKTTRWYLKGQVQLEPMVLTMEDLLPQKARRKVTAVRIPLGKVAVALESGGIVGQERSMKKYFGGEQVIVQRGDEITLLLMRRHLLSLHIEIRQWLPAISWDEKDWATFLFLIEGRVEQPDYLVWNVGEGKSVEEFRERALQEQQKLAELVGETCEHFLQEEDNLRIWSLEEKDVLGAFEDLLKKKLETWGISVEVRGRRVYPQVLYEVGVELGSAEERARYLLERHGTLPWATNGDDFSQGLSRAREEGRVPGEWLLAVAQEYPEMAEQIVNWLQGKELFRAAQLVAHIAKEAKMGTARASTQLSVKLVMKALRQPRLTIGEWRPPYDR